MTDERLLKDSVRKLALNHGFELCAFARPEVKANHQHGYAAWIDAGMHGDMAYMAEESRLKRRLNPVTLLEGVRTVITLGMRHTPPSYTLEQAEADSSRGVIAAYAHGDDYHETVKKRLKALAAELDKLLGQHDQRVYVDTAPVLEHALAENAGLGWQGKHTLTINRELGSWLMLGEIFTTADLTADEAAGFHCGSCTACIDICPTRAIVEPFTIDARLCISYLTIEYKGFIPEEIRAIMGNRIFGCDDCQMVCPWNRKNKSLTLDHLSPRPENVLPELTEIFLLDDEGFRTRFRKSPVKRPGRAGLLRNVAIAMGNSGNRDFIPLLIAALDDAEPLVRGHAVWALAKLYPQTGGGEIAARLSYHAERERDEEVLRELHQALTAIGEVNV